MNHHVGRFVACACVLTAAAALAQPAPENLLRNGGFEELAGEAPAYWKHFVQPMDGAYARASTRFANEGVRSVTLHIPRPYADEPYNNWSQNILQPLGGETLELRASIRTEDAVEAAVWVQAFQRRPLRELLRESTASHVPISGTSAWQTVRMTAAIPKTADFVTVRCVLIGQGTAWFDGIALTQMAEDRSATFPGPERPAAERPDAPEPPASPDVPEAPDPLAARGEQQTQDARLDQLLEANAELLETVRTLRDSNDNLAEEVLRLQRDLARLRRALEERAPAPPRSGSSAENRERVAVPRRPAAPVPPERATIERVPPLVPRGHDLDGSSNP